VRETLGFMMYDWLNVEVLTSRARYIAYNREILDSILDVSEKIAAEKFGPLNRLIDQQEPAYIDGQAILPDGVADALDAYAASGLLAAGHDEEVGGMQLPYVIDMAAHSFFALHSISLSAFGMLTCANANLLMAYGSEAQKAAFALPQLQGRYSGTMCLSEPQAGSSLGDITTRAVPDGANYQAHTLGPRYRIKGNKVWISGAGHHLTDNIIHLVLAKIPDENGDLPLGTKGISLFVVPGFLVNEDSELDGKPNDIVLAGLNHKLGYRGIPNTLLNFGDSAGAIGYRIGNAGQGLAIMFHMMNEARINIGMGAAMLGQAGYKAALEYARTRRQGYLRSMNGTRRDRQQARIIEHADVKRMLLAQKSLSEGALALVLYCARLVDDKRTGGPVEQRRATVLLELLTPIAKSWPSEWCLEANSLAIQVLGGAGYTRDFPVEQYWRDNRLNMIHEGTHGIQATDLLARKIRQNNGEAFYLWVAEVRRTVSSCATTHTELEPFARQLEHDLSCLIETTQKSCQDSMFDLALAHATPYMQAFGHIVIAWLWLDVVRAVLDHPGLDASFRAGKQAAMKYFFACELPKSAHWLNLILKEDATVQTMAEDWF